MAPKGIPVSSLPPCSVDSKVQWLNVLVNRSQPGDSWASGWSPPVGWWSECSGYNVVVIFLWGCMSQVSEESVCRLRIEHVNAIVQLLCVAHWATAALASSTVESTIFLLSICMFAIMIKSLFIMYAALCRSLQVLISK